MRVAGVEEPGEDGHELNLRRVRRVWSVRIGGDVVGGGLAIRRRRRTGRSRGCPVRRRRRCGWYPSCRSPRGIGRRGAVVRSRQSAASICWPHPPCPVRVGGDHDRAAVAPLGLLLELRQRALRGRRTSRPLGAGACGSDTPRRQRGDEAPPRRTRPSWIASFRSSRRRARGGCVGAAGRRGARLGADRRETGAEERRALVEDGDLFRGHRRGSCARAEAFLQSFSAATRVVTVRPGFSVGYRLFRRFLSGPEKAFLVPGSYTSSQLEPLRASDERGGGSVRPSPTIGTVHRTLTFIPVGASFEPLSPMVRGRAAEPDE